MTGYSWPRYAGGYGDPDALRAEIEEYGLSQAGRAALLAAQALSTTTPKQARVPPTRVCL